MSEQKKNKISEFLSIADKKRLQQKYNISLRYLQKIANKPLYRHAAYKEIIELAEKNKQEHEELLKRTRRIEQMESDDDYLMEEFNLKKP